MYAHIRRFCRVIVVPILSFTDLAHNWPHDATPFDQHIVVAKHSKERSREQRTETKPGDPSDGVAPEVLTNHSPHAVPHTDSDRGHYGLDVHEVMLAVASGVGGIWEGISIG